MTSESSPTHPQAVPTAVPTSAEEALGMVRSKYGQPLTHDGTPAPMHVHEFDIGYLVYATFPPPAPDAAGRPRPAQPGGSHIVVAKDTGDTFTVPNYPVEAAIAVYRKQHRPNAQ
ncbi:hypothetical protein ABZW18_20315 [Streptomyces sp. NPDC004647]|uniref:hypothetical protein n=1 Tax=Streptomyces sp. NPDC004647 TaxID=3154671 RepID=UPI0033A80DD9